MQAPLSTRYSDLNILLAEKKEFRKRVKSIDRDKKVNRKMQYGGDVRGNGFKLQIEFFNKHLFFAFLKIGFLTLIPVIFFCFVAIASAEEATNVTLPISMITSFKTLLTLIILIPVICLVPFFIAFRAFRDNDRWKDYPLAMPKGSVRALLAFSLVVLIAIMLVLFRCFNEIISALLAILASIVGYYFGQRSVGGEPKEEREPVNPQISPETKNTPSAEQKLKWSQELREWIFKLSQELREWIFRKKTKTSEDIEKLHQTIEGLSTTVEKIKEEFVEFKAEVSNKLEKLEESAGKISKIGGENEKKGIARN